MASGTRDNLVEQRVNRPRSLTEQRWSVLYKRAWPLYLRGLPGHGAGF